MINGNHSPRHHPHQRGRRGSPGEDDLGRGLGGQSIISFVLVYSIIGVCYYCW